ncbi:integrator complex subunit 6 [Ciona intestinalis]
MQTVVFVIDNSASMNQTCYLGKSLLDVAKGAVETFIKQRANRGDKYMLVTFDEAPNGIRAGWRECQNHGMVLNRLKNLTADGLTTLGYSLRLSFDLLGVNRHLTNIDTYGMGRSPFYLDPSMIIAITDGAKLSSSSAVYDELHLPMTNPLPGSELTKEPFRWDQRLFSLVLRLPANPTQEPEQLGSVPSDSSPISLMCEVTGGRSYCIKTQKTLMQCLDSLVQKSQSGVVIHFERFDTDSADKRNGKPEATNGINNETPSWHSLHRMIYVRPSPKSGLPVGHWPLPEAYCPDQKAPTLPPRTAHPILRFICQNVEPILLTNFPYDKYELEPSPLTQVLLEKKNPNTCWKVFVDNSGKQSGVRHPCGYLKCSSNLQAVNLFVMPYNYPVILPLIDQLIKQKMKPSNDWRRQFDDYLKMVPPYYMNSLRKALKQVAAPNNLISDSYGPGLSYPVTVYFKKLKEQTKVAADRFFAPLANDVSNRGVSVTPRSGALSVTQQPNFHRLLASVSGEGTPFAQVELMQFPEFRISQKPSGHRPHPRKFHNPFDIPRNQLLTQLREMRVNFNHVVRSSIAEAVGSTGQIAQNKMRVRLQDRVEIHNQPMSQMGNYQDYIKGLPAPLREANPDTPKRLHTFGNPFKLAKEKGMMIDETEDYDGPSASASPKRKSGQEQGGPPHKRKRLGSFSKKFNLKSPTHDVQKDNVVQKIEGKKSGPSNEQQNEGEEIKKNSQDEIEIHDSGVESSSDFLTIDVKSEEIEKHINTGQMKKHRSLKSDKKKLTSPLLNSNNTVKVEVVKLIRKPGLHTVKVVELLKDMVGTSDVKNILLETLITEAGRFKRHKLINVMKAAQKSLQDDNA